MIVVDDLGNPVQGAVVTGDFTGTLTESGVSGPTTDATGATVIQTSGTAKGNVGVTFCVTSVTHPALANWTGEFCDSS